MKGFKNLKYGILSLCAGVLLVMQIPIAMSADASSHLKASMIIYKSLRLSLMASMSFPAQEEVSADKKITIAPGSTNAAVYNMTGKAGNSLQASVEQTAIAMKCESGSTCGTAEIKVDSFTFGGNLAADGKAVVASNGVINNLRVGATATLTSSVKAGEYSGEGTFRIAYVKPTT